MVFAAGFRHLVQHARPESEWLGTLTFGAAAVWLAVTLVADGLMGGAVLDTLRGDADASAVRALVMGTVLIYNGSIAFAITGLFLVSAAWGHARQRRAASLDGLARPYGGGIVSDLRAGDVLRSRRRGGVLQRRGLGASHHRELPPADVVPGRRRRADPPRSRRREYFGRGAAAPVGVIGPGSLRIVVCRYRPDDGVDLIERADRDASGT